MGIGERRLRLGCVGLIFSFFLVSGTLAGENTSVEPRDEADRDLSLIEFRESLTLAVQNRSPEQFVTFLHHNIYNGKQSKPGTQAFVEKWKPEAFDSELWAVMTPILEMGGGFVRSEKGVQFCAPYVFTHFPDQFDIFGSALVIREGVDLMSEASSSSTKVATLNYDVLKVIDWRRVPDANGTVNQFWLNVELPDGTKGYVISEYLRSPSDYSACFLQDRKGDWKLMSLSSSDD